MAKRESCSASSDQPDAALEQCFRRDGLKQALHLLEEFLRRWGQAGIIRVYAHHAETGMYLGLAELNPGPADCDPQVTPVYDRDLPPGLRPARHPDGREVIRLDDGLNQCKGVKNYRYAIRHELFADGEITCYLGILTDAPHLCSPEANDWLHICTAGLGKALRESMNLQATFSGTFLDEPLGRLKACPRLHDVVRQIERVAPTRVTVLVHGETGVGKEYVAESIHQLSAFRNGPFVAVNCGAIPETLVDSMLFGHEKGAFTGACARSEGYFEQAQNGTLFLDEIGELPLLSQARLLRVLEKRTILRVGGARFVPLNIRIVAATNRNLEERVREKAFREDLFYRLNTFTITIPPLRDRTLDITALLNYFLPRKTEEYGLKRQPPLPRRESDKLYAHTWPGNVREFENTIDRAFIQILGMPEGTPLRIEFPAAAVPASDQRRYGVDEEPIFSGRRPLEEIVNAYVRYIMGVTGGKIYGPHGAARILKIHPNTLRSRLEKMRWTPESSPADQRESGNNSDPAPHVITS